VAHADVNAAFNIATTRNPPNVVAPDDFGKTTAKKQVRELARVQDAPGFSARGIPDLPGCENILALLD
jgi:hypothetical protein